MLLPADRRIAALSDGIRIKFVSQLCNEVKLEKKLGKNPNISMSFNNTEEME